MRTLTNRAKLIAAGAIGTRPYHLAELMDGRKHREPDMTNRTADNLGAIDRRNFLVGAGIGAAALAGAGPLEAQAADNAAATPVRETGAASEPETVKLERVGNGLLLIAIDRPEQQNLIDVPTFRALGRAYYEFEHDDALRVAVLHGQGADFSAGYRFAVLGDGIESRLWPAGQFHQSFGHQRTRSIQAGGVRRAGAGGADRP